MVHAEIDRLSRSTESSRVQDLQMFSSGDLKPAVITDSQIKVNIYREAAMVTGLTILREPTGSRWSVQSPLCELRLRDGRWQIVRHQATPIADDKSGSQGFRKALEKHLIKMPRYILFACTRTLKK